MVSHLNSFRYVEMDGEFIETPCQNFEEVPEIVATTKSTLKFPKITRPPLKMASLKDARAVAEEGGCTIWGQLPDIPYKSDKFGLGFTTEAQRVVRRSRIGGPPLRISNQGVNAVEDSDGNCDMDEWIFPTTGGGLNNWEAKDFIPITFLQEYFSFNVFRLVIFKQFRLF